MKAGRFLPSDLPETDVEQLVGTSFFASRPFANLWAAKGGRPVYWAIVARERMVALLPGVEFGRGPFARMVAMPDGCYGRLFVRPDWEDRREELCRQLIAGLRKHGYAKLFIYDFFNTLPTVQDLHARDYQTGIVDISAPDWQPPDKKLQSQIRKAQREGIEVVDFHWERHGEKFLELSQRTEQRHGRPPKYSREFFQALAGLAQDDDRVAWVWCEHDGRPACSHIYFIEGDMLQGWQIYFDKAFSFLKPNQYIRFTMCHRTAQRGVKRLNLGWTPPTADGLAYYKDRWGGEMVTYRCYWMKHGLGRFL